MQRLTRRRLLAATAGLTYSCSRQPAPEAISAPKPELLATYYPTPKPVVRRMLEMSGLGPDEVHYDLGSGDGRFVLIAAKEFGARSVGFEIDDKLIAESRCAIQAAKLGDRAEIRSEDLMLADYSQPDVISCFLTPEGLEKAVPRMERTLQPGTRVVAYKFPLPGWTPDEREEMVDPDPEIPLHEMYLYRWRG